MTERLREKLGEQVDAASLVAFRVIFGLAAIVAAVRFWQMGWIDTYLVDPPNHLHYAGFEWVRPLSSTGMHLVFAGLVVAAACIALGLFYRLAVLAYFLLFTYAELIDQALYLNHYYAVSLIAFAMLFLPLAETGSLDALRRAVRGIGTAPKWALYLVRTELGLVYFFAGVAKLKADWLLHAEPLRTWLLARTDFPVLGPFFQYAFVAFAMCWAGTLFDLTVPFFLSIRRTRPFAYAAVVGFHAITGLLFNIGLFPLLMIVYTLVFFEPDWPRRALARVGLVLRQAAPTTSTLGPRMPRAGFAAASVFVLLQVAIPLRHYAMPGDVLWTYEGFNFAWHVMIAEKGAQVDLLAVGRETGAVTLVPPCDHYTRLQVHVLAENPELIVQFAHVVADDFRRRGHDVAIYARSYASLNGRPMQELVAGDVDLTTIHAWTPASRYVRPLGYQAPAPRPFLAVAH